MVERPSAWVLLLAVAMAVVAGPAADQQQKKKAPDAGAYSIVSGTVFRDNGLSLAEAEVTLELAADAPAKSKVKKLRSVSSPRGEFTFRVPPDPAKYRITVSAKGFRGDSKIVEVSGGAERIEATFSLAPESK